MSYPDNIMRDGRKDQVLGGYLLEACKRGHPYVDNYARQVALEEVGSSERLKNDPQGWVGTNLGTMGRTVLLLDAIARRSNDLGMWRRCLLNYLRDQVDHGQPREYQYGLRGGAEPRAPGYAGYTHRAWLTLMKLRSHVGGKLADVARHLLRLDLATYAWTAGPDLLVATAAGRIYGHSLALGLDPSYGLFASLAHQMAWPPSGINFDTFWSQNQSYTLHIWREEPQLVEALWTTAEAVALLALMRHNRVEPPLLRLLAQVRLYRHSLVVLRGPRGHLSYLATEGAYKAGDNMTRTIASKTGRGHGGFSAVWAEEHGRTETVMEGDDIVTRDDHPMRRGLELGRLLDWRGIVGQDPLVVHFPEMAPPRVGGLGILEIEGDPAPPRVDPARGGPWDRAAARAVERLSRPDVARDPELAVRDVNASWKNDPEIDL